MTIEVHAVQRMRVYSEPTFATDYTGSIGSFTDLPFREGTGSLTLTTDSLDPQQAVQSRLEYRKEVLGKKSATLAFTVNLAPTGVAAVTTVSSVQSAVGLLLKAVMGGEDLGQGSTSAAGSTAIIVNAQTGHGSRWAAGGAVGWVNGSGVLEVREIESIATDAITLKYGFSGAPAENDALYNAATYFFTEDPQESLQVYAQGYEVSDKWLLMGGQCTGLTLALDPSGGQLPALTLNLQFADWLDSGDMAATPTLGTATYSNFEPIVGHAGDFRSWTVGSPTFSAAHAVDVSACAFAPVVAFIPVTSPGGTNTIKRWRAGRAGPAVTGSFTTYYEDLSWWTLRDARTDRAVQFQLGTAAASAVVLSAPTVQVVNPQRVDASGIAVQTIEWKGRRDTDVGVSTTALAKSPFRIHFV